MATIPERFVEPLQFAAQDLKGLLRPDSPEDERLVQRGLMLFRQKLVYWRRFDSDQITAVVQDVTPANVLLDLDFIHLSKCSCPAEGICRHQLAAFFQLLSHTNSVSTWVEEWRKPMKEKRAVKQWSIQKAKDLLKTTGRLEPDYDQWITSFHEGFDTIMSGKGEPKPYLISELFRVYEKRWKAGAPFEQEWKYLYLLIGYVSSFQKLMELSVELDHSEDVINRYYRQSYQALLEDTEDVIQKLSVHSLPFSFDTFIERLKNDSSALLTTDFELEYERAQLYRLLWTHFFKKKAWREEEIQKIKTHKSTSLPVVVGLVHLYILERNDEEALKLLGDPEETITPYLLYWLDLFTSQKDWKRMGPYVEAFIAKLKNYLTISDDYYAKRKFIKLAMKAIMPYCTETGRLDLYEKGLIETLPHSFAEYEYLLFDNKKFDKWTDLLVYMDYTIDMLSSERIKTVEKDNPAMLLPLYHHAIQDHITLKGRDHYRQAVRKMKKLRTLYKKLKRQDEWELFLSILLDKNKRLRAFQEECQRGKLIDA